MRTAIRFGLAILFASAGTAAAQQPARLQLGQTVNATLSPNDTVRHELDLPAGHFVAGRVEQDGTDATVTVTSPGGERVLRAARVGRGGPEAFAFAADSAGRYVIAERPTAASGVDVPIATLRRYAGKYEMTTLGGMLVTVELEDGQLRVELPGQPPLPLQATSTTMFQVVGAPAQISFETTDDGTVEGIVFHQDGEHPGRPVAAATPPDLAAYEGRYFSEELETFYDLVVEDGTLVIRHRRFGPAPLTWTEGDSFSGTMPVSQVVFQRDAQGRITGFLAGNGRARDILFEKVGQ